jgi:hypothetical protein
MKKLFLLSFLFLLLKSVTSQTLVNGFISTNTQWNLAGSPYIVTGNTLLMQGFTLTIEPGVVVKFDTNKALQIDGELIAIGTVQNKITFTSNQPVPTSGDWAKIHFSDVCNSATFDTSGNYISGSIMKYCDIKYGGSIGFGEIHIITSSPYFSHCTVSFSASDGIYSEMTTYSIDSSRISDCEGIGLHFFRYFQNSCSITIQDDSVLNNTGGGIKFEGVYSFLNCNYLHFTQIRRNVFMANSPFALWGLGNQYDSLFISDNIFENNYGSRHTLSINATTYAIGCNRFINNQTLDGILALGGDNYSSLSSSFHIQENIFQGNTIGNGKSIIYVINSANSKNIYITNNIIENNSSPGGEILSIEAKISNIFQVHHNNFVNNNALSCIFLSTPFGSQGSNYTYCDVRYNNLVNPACQYEFYNNVPYGLPNIVADSIYWGSQSTQHVDSVIFDFFDFANQSVVFYQPILLFPTEVDTVCHILSIDIDQIETKSLFSFVFPNPFTENTTIRFEKRLNNAAIMMFNIFGQLVKMKEHLSGNEILFSRDNLPEGVYFYSVFDGDSQKYRGKVIVN